jgi:ABC-type multidrug transport system fused ATPase/permease subunit
MLLNQTHHFQHANFMLILDTHKYASSLVHTQATGACERVFQLLDRTAPFPISGGFIPQSITGHVEFKDVSFAYPSRDTKILKHVSLVLTPGTVTALVGESGGGKSTVVQVLERFYDIKKDEGAIFLDGRDIRDLDPSWMRRNMGYISQEPVLFATTIRANLFYGSGEVPEAVLIEACRMANALDFIMGFPDKFDTVVGERGLRLSGGQKQRIAIARAILMDPKILIADEATSALDAESEFHVQQALDNLMKGRTVLVIAHRLSTVKEANNVIVMEQGQVAEQGTHDELLRKSGRYAKLVRRQLAQSQEEQQALTSSPLTGAPE